MEFFEFDNSFLGGDGRGYGQQHSALTDEKSTGTVISGGKSYGTVTCAQAEFYKANNGRVFLEETIISRGLTELRYDSCTDACPFQGKSVKGGSLAPKNGGAFGKGPKF